MQVEKRKISKYAKGAIWQLPKPTRRSTVLLLRKRTIVEIIIDRHENISQLEHFRHPSVANFMVNGLCALIAYCHQPKKPSLRREQPFQRIA